jgi:hypothetical protein
MTIQKRIGSNTFNGVFSYAGMPIEMAEQNIRSFARDVMPELRKVDL